jgi:hypothetical protein
VDDCKPLPPAHPPPDHLVRKLARAAVGEGYHTRTTPPIGPRRNKVTRHWFEMQGWPMGVVRSDTQPDTRPSCPRHKQSHRLDGEEAKSRAIGSRCRAGQWASCKATRNPEDPAVSAERAVPVCSGAGCVLERQIL